MAVNLATLDEDPYQDGGDWSLATSSVQPIDVRLSFAIRALGRACGSARTSSSSPSGLIKTTRIPILVMLGILLAWPAFAAQVRVTGVQKFKKAELKKVVIVTLDCDALLNCAAIQRNTNLAMGKAKKGLEVVPDSVVREALFEHNLTTYTTEHRELLGEALGLDGLVELKVPLDRKGIRASQAQVEVTIVRPDGELLLHGTGIGAPANRALSPEGVANNVIEKILKRVKR